MRNLDTAADAIVGRMRRQAARNGLHGAIAFIITTHSLEEGRELLQAALESIEELVG